MGTYRIRASGLAHEVVEGEAILIDFATGCYYSLDGVGGLAWARLAAGPGSAASLAGALGPALAVDAQTLRQALAGLLQQMAEEGLVVETEADPVALPPLAPPSPAPFAPPVLQKYTDLEALLLLDPIHDVLSEGWPHAQPASGPDLG